MNKLRYRQLFLLCPLRSSLCSTVKLDIKEVERKEERQALSVRVPQTDLSSFRSFRFPFGLFPLSDSFQKEMLRLMNTLFRRSKKII